ncbi:hypothetical protein RRG08_057519 [Elysia crispata]|uniref:DUF5641 domain-containing protein n=1 Tax=Elysia crispata TaxID=231223 RepID=A0AAE1B488_9GAST|nr:hypothetical protein RRG08_057519 [Elysia crispata]
MYEVDSAELNTEELKPAVCVMTEPKAQSLFFRSIDGDLLCHLSLLLVRDAHLKFKHADVNQMVSTLRNQYWVIGFSVLAKIVKAECLPCKRLDAKACQEPIAPLMEARLKQAPPFHVVGTDFAGPIYYSSLETINSQKELMEKQLIQFWNRWQNEYLKQLPLPKRRDKCGKLERIHDLELHAHPVLDMPELGNGQVSTTRCGRQSEAPDRFMITQ